jgi:hypothetical protein
MALAPPPVLCRQLGAAPTQPHMPGGRGPLRVHHAVSQALVTSALPAVRTRVSSRAVAMYLCERTRLARAGGGAEARRVRRVPSYDRDFMHLVVLKGVIGLEGHIELGLVTGLKGHTGRNVLTVVSDAAIRGTAGKEVGNVAFGEQARRGSCRQRRTMGGPLAQVMTRAPARRGLAMVDARKGRTAYACRARMM